MSDEKVPVGTKVSYHGSIAYLHGEYEIDSYSDLSLRKDIPESIRAEHWPNGEAYDLWPVGVPKKFGNRDRALYCVRRESFDIVEES